MSKFMKDLMRDQLDKWYRDTAQTFANLHQPSLTLATKIAALDEIQQAIPLARRKLIAFHNALDKTGP